jgi:GMP synthase (glutamine-hydrolysing)
MDLRQLAALIETRSERFIEERLARSEADVAAIVADFRDLHAEPERKDLAWKYALGPDILDPVRRTLEFRNWLLAEVVGNRLP